MKFFLRNNTVFLLGWAIVLSGMIAALGAIPKPELHLLLNACHSKWLDIVLQLYTRFVEWPVYVLMLLPLLCRRWGKTAMFAAAELSSALVIQLIKQLWNMPRPKTFFAELGGSWADAFNGIVVDGVQMHSWHSFPSGHTATFFVFFGLCAFMWAGEEKPLKGLIGALCLILALIGGYSRIYLSQHFLLDVCTGMAEGTLMAAIWYNVFVKKGWIDKTFKQHKS